MAVILKDKAGMQRRLSCAVDINPIEKSVNIKMYSELFLPDGQGGWTREDSEQKFLGSRTITNKQWIDSGTGVLTTEMIAGSEVISNPKAVRGYTYFANRTVDSMSMGKDDKVFTKLFNVIETFVAANSLHLV